MEKSTWEFQNMYKRKVDESMSRRLSHRGVRNSRNQGYSRGIMAVQYWKECLIEYYHQYYKEKPDI